MQAAPVIYLETIDAITVKLGDTVRIGQTLGKMGKYLSPTGRYHLHLEAKLGVSRQNSVALRQELDQMFLGGHLLSSLEELLLYHEMEEKTDGFRGGYAGLFTQFGRRRPPLGASVLLLLLV